LKRLVFVSLSALLLLILVPITGCITVQIPPLEATSPAGAPPVIGTFTNTPATINSGGTSTLLWNVTGANSVSIDQGIGKVDVMGVKLITPATSTIYTISATNSAGTVTKSAITTVNSASLPLASTPPVILAFSSNLNSDGSSTLLWNVTGANSVSIDQNVGPVNVAGIRVVTPASSTVYTLSATNATGTVMSSAVTTVNPALPPQVRMPAVITNFSSYFNSDGTTTLSWNVTGADTVSIDQYIGMVNASGTIVVSPAVATAYTLTATYAIGNWANEIGTVTRSVVTSNKSGTQTPWVQ
jgi:hypothetical protein